MEEAMLIGVTSPSSSSTPRQFVRCSSDLHDARLCALQVPPNALLKRGSLSVSPPPPTRHPRYTSLADAVHALMAKANRTKSTADPPSNKRMRELWGRLTTKHGSSSEMSSSTGNMWEGERAINRNRAKSTSSKNKYMKRGALIANPPSSLLSVPRGSRRRRASNTPVESKEAFEQQRMSKSQIFSGDKLRQAAEAVMKSRHRPSGSLSAAQSPLAATSCSSIAKDDDATSLAESGGGDTLKNGARRARSTTRLASIFLNRSGVSDMLTRLEELKGEKGCVSRVNEEMLREKVMPDLQGVEGDWRDIVNGSENLSRKQLEQQAAIWEIVTTEKSFLQVLGQLTDLQHYMSVLQQEGYLCNIDVDIVFINIVEIYRTNMGFWNHAIAPLLAVARADRSMLDAAHLADAFEHIGHWCIPYIQFNVEYERAHGYIRKKKEESEMFREFVQWTAGVGGDRLTVDHHLARVMQRVTKYHLLLAAVLTPTTDVGLSAVLRTMINHAKDAANRVNVELCHHKQLNTLNVIMGQIECYEPIDAPKDEELASFIGEVGGRLELTSAMPFCPNAILRSLMHRGDARLREGGGKAIDVHLMLFTDMLLICKRKGDKLKVIRPPFNVDRVLVRQLGEFIGFALVYLNEFRVVSSACTLYMTTAEDVNRWMEFVHMAKEEYERCRHTTFIEADAKGEQRINIHHEFDSISKASNSLLTPNSIESAQRRISIGSLLDPSHRTAMASTSRQPASRDNNGHRGIIHRKSISMDNNEVDRHSELCRLASSHSTNDVMEGKHDVSDKKHDVMEKRVVVNESTSPMGETEGEGKMITVRRRGDNARYLTTEGLRSPNDPSIMKRLSMTVAVGAIVRVTTEGSTKTMSSESFSSSTSGVSSSGSHQHISRVCVEEERERPLMSMQLSSNTTLAPCAESDVTPCRGGDEPPLLPCLPPPDVLQLPSRQHLIDMLTDQHMETSDV